ncbi:unnamed protein product, partial [Ixodes pacificus]
MASVKVAVRARPFNQREINMESGEIIQMDGNKTTILNLKFQSLISSPNIVSTPRNKCSIKSLCVFVPTVHTLLSIVWCCHHSHGWTFFTLNS